MVEKFLVGPKDFGGSCPSPAHKYGHSCCCEAACCWGNCRKDNPPQSCLDGVPNSQWVYNTEKLRYQAVRNFIDKGMYFFDREIAQALAVLQVANVELDFRRLIYTLYTSR